jgi:hypothetical protein
MGKRKLNRHHVMALNDLAQLAELAERQVKAHAMCLTPDINGDGCERCTACKTRDAASCLALGLSKLVAENQ